MPAPKPSKRARGPDGDVNLLDPLEVVVAARASAPGLHSFASFVGKRATTGCCRRAFDALVRVGLDRQSAWWLAGDWDRLIDEEQSLGWTPEARLIQQVMRELPGRWHEVDWDKEVVILARPKPR